MSSNLSEIKDEIKSRINIVDFIGRYINLKKTGSNYMGLCPFHDDSKSPSFSVVADKDFYHCFGCGKSGDIFTFLMEYESLTFSDALKELAKEAGVELKKSNSKFDSSSMYDIISLAQNFFNEQLLQNIEAKNYLNSRKIDIEWAKDYGIGFAPENWNMLQNYLFKHKVDNQIAIELGLLGNKNNKLFDKFRGRIMLPFHNDSGHVIGFTGRAIRDDINPKYMNSPENELFHKSSVIFGFHKSKEYIRGNNRVIIVEGNLDFISLYYRGIKNVIAISGSAFSNTQAKKLSILCNNATIMLDGDSAGFKAAKRVITPLLNNGIEFDIVILPKDEDPDSLINKIGKDEFKKFLKNSSIDFIQFLKEFYKSQYGENINQTSNQEKIFIDLIEILKAVDNQFIQEILITKISKNFNFKEKLIESYLYTQNKLQNRNSETDYNTKQTTKIKKAYLSQILIFLLKMPEYIKPFIDNIPNSKLGEWKLFFDNLYDIYRKNSNEDVENRYLHEFLLTTTFEEDISKNIKKRILEDINKIQFKTIKNYYDKLNGLENSETKHINIEELKNRINEQFNSIISQLKKKR